MQPVDYAIVVVYVLACTALGTYFGAGTKGLKGYFLGGHSIPAWAVMISIVATETSTATFLSVPGIAYREDMRFLQLPLGYLIGRVIVAVVLLPSYFRGEIFTAYQLLRDRFGGATRTTASVIFLATRVPADGIRLFLAAGVLKEITQWPIGWAIIAVGLTTIVYTYLGGMKAVIWIDVIQFAIYIVGAIIALNILANLLPGGWGQIVQQGRAEAKFRVFDFGWDLRQPYTFWAGLIGGMVLNTATHGADQLMVQRYLAARSERQAAGALVASGFVVLAQFALFLFIGVALFVFYRQFPPTAGPLVKDREFASFIVHFLPVGILGVVVAAIFSAAMGTLSGSLNASASTTVNDLYRPLFPHADERQLLWVSKGMTAVWGVAQMGAAFFATQLEKNAVEAALAIASFTTGLVLGLFLLGIATRVGQRAALVGLVAGLAAVSAVRFGPGLGLTRNPVPIAWPWYALIGSTTVVLVGVLVDRFAPGIQGTANGATGSEPSPSPG